MSFTSLYQRILPSVVSVHVTEGFGGAGSGFIYDEHHLVTNHHVVRDVPEVDIRFANGTWRVGRVVGTDAYTDLAVVRVPDLPADAAPLPLAREPPAPGTPVAALGNPMGLDGSISTGIVSGANRTTPTGNGYVLPDTVQTDAAINPGNSGGPLVTEDGLVVGVNRAKAGDNIGFAVSAAVVARVVPALIADGHYRHPYLSIRTLDVSPTVAAANDLDAPRGVLVVAVATGPASGALVGCDRETAVHGRAVPVGGDVIVAVDGEAVDSHEALMRHLLLETTPGETVALSLVRGGEAVTENVTLAERPAPPGSESTRIPVR